MSALARQDWVNFGARQSHYPADARALSGWNRLQIRWVEAHARPLVERVSLAEIDRLAGIILGEREVIRS